MIDYLPLHVSIAFGMTTLLTLILFIWVIKNSNAESTRKKAIPILILLIIWIVIQTILTLKNVYNTDTNSFPPKIMLFGVLPTFATMILLFTTHKGKKFIDSLPLTNLTYLNIIRIPVEIVLLWLFLNAAVPEIMTFEGWNYDILAGITAPFIAYFGLTKNKLSHKVILIWNFVCLALLINIILIALFSVQTPLQKFGFDRPNIAILYYPFSLLPTFVVPVVLFGHFTSIRQLLSKTK